MALSSSSLFHFTKSLDTFKNILVNGFRVNPSIESYSFLGNQAYDLQYAITIPMVCFCDIPISLIKNHAEFYGGDKPFAFGLSREWGERNCSPVIYHPPYGPFKNTLNIFTTVFERLSGSEKFLWEPGFVEAFTTLGNKEKVRRIPHAELFFKPVSGPYNYGGQFNSPAPSHVKYNFYDEREWRYIPLGLPRLPFHDYWAFDSLRDSDSIDKESYQDYTNEFFNNGQKIKNTLRNLEFSINDISYLIVDCEDTLKQLLNWLLDVQNQKKIGGQEVLKSEDIYYLMTRLISYEDIKKNILTA